MDEVKKRDDLGFLNYLKIGFSDRKRIISPLINSLFILILLRLLFPENIINESIISILPIFVGCYIGNSIAEYWEEDKILDYIFIGIIFIFSTVSLIDIWF